MSAMFYIGSNVLDWPLEAQRAVTDGTFHPFPDLLHAC
jgi:hypothetical protein